MCIIYAFLSVFCPVQGPVVQSIVSFNIKVSKRFLMSASAHKIRSKATVYFAEKKNEKKKMNFSTKLAAFFCIYYV